MSIKDIDWKATLATVAPALATALGGPLAGLATQALSTALLGGKADGSQAEVAAALASGGMDALLAVKKAEQQFTLDLKKIDVDLEKLSQVDRASARDREVQIKDKTPAVLAAAITIGFFGILWMMMQGELPEHGTEALLVMLGSLGTAWLSIVSYFFGSSSGSAAKSIALERLGAK